jgi:hypothetical protein
LVAVAAIVVVTDPFGNRGPERAGGASVGQVTGGRDDWTAAVCQDGSLSQPSSANFRFPGVTSTAYCAAKQPSTASRSVSLLVAEWPTGVAVGEALARNPSIHCFAAAPAGEGTMVFAPISSTDQSVLAPLAQFGFTIVALP